MSSSGQKEVSRSSDLVDWTTSSAAMRSELHVPRCSHLALVNGGHSRRDLRQHRTLAWWASGDPNAHVHAPARTAPQARRRRETAGGAVCAGCAGRLPMAHDESVCWVALRRKTRFGFAKALAHMRSEQSERWWTCSCCCVVVWPFQSDEGRDWVGAVDNWLWEHTTTGACDPNSTVWPKGVLVRGSVEHDVSCLRKTHQSACGLKLKNTETKFIIPLNGRPLDRMNDFAGATRRLE